MGAARYQYLKHVFFSPSMPSLVTVLNTRIVVWCSFQHSGDIYRALLCMRAWSSYALLPRAQNLFLYAYDSLYPSDSSAAKCLFCVFPLHAPIDLAVVLRRQAATRLFSRTSSLRSMRSPGQTARRFPLRHRSPPAPHHRLPPRLLQPRRPARTQARRITPSGPQPPLRLQAVTYQKRDMPPRWD